MKEIEFKLDFSNFYCPVTGEQVLDPGMFSPSPAMVFAFLHSERVFEHLRENLREQFSEEFRNEGRHGELYLKISQEVLREEQNYLWITYGATPSGYVSFCFDMTYKDPEEDEKEHPFYLNDSLPKD